MKNCHGVNIPYDLKLILIMFKSYIFKRKLCFQNIFSTAMTASKVKPYKAKMYYKNL